MNVIKYPDRGPEGPSGGTLHPRSARFLILMGLMLMMIQIITRQKHLLYTVKRTRSRAKQSLKRITYLKEILLEHAWKLLISQLCLLPVKFNCQASMK